MALDAGVMSVTLQFAQGLKDGDWFGRSDPYCIVTVGSQTFRTKTHVDGGRNPVWNETFSFNLINENNAEVVVMDEDVGPDDVLGVSSFNLANARRTGSDTLQVPVVSRRSRKQHGCLWVVLKWEPNEAVKPSPAPAPAPAAAPAPAPAPAVAQQPAVVYMQAPGLPAYPGPYPMAYMPQVPGMMPPMHYAYPPVTSAPGCYGAPQPVAPAGPPAVPGPVPTR